MRIASTNFPGRVSVIAARLYLDRSNNVFVVYLSTWASYLTFCFKTSPVDFTSVFALDCVHTLSDCTDVAHMTYCIDSHAGDTVSKLSIIVCVDDVFMIFTLTLADM